VVALSDLAASPGASELKAGALAVQKEEWVAAQKTLGFALEQRAKANERPDVLMAGYALLGRSYATDSAAPQAEAAYRKVLTLWNAPATADAMKSAGGDAAGREQRDRAVLAAAEAMFFFAEQMRHRANRLQMPVYGGTSEREGVRAFFKTEVAEFIQRKQPLLVEADVAYRRILDLQPVPSRWAVAALASMATMRGRFAVEPRAAPIPRAWMRPGQDLVTLESYDEIRAFYHRSLDELTLPLRARARVAYEACAEDARRLSVDDERSRSCARWLARNVK